MSGKDEELRKISVFLRDSVHIEAKHLADLEHKSLTAWVAELIEWQIEKQAQRREKAGR